jgi:hypothetical protein
MRMRTGSDLKNSIFPWLDIPDTGNDSLAEGQGFGGLQ